MARRRIEKFCGGFYSMIKAKGIRRSMSRNENCLFWSASNKNDYLNYYNLRQSERACRLQFTDNKPFRLLK